MRPSLPLVLLALSLALGACDGFAPSDEPLPEFGELVEAYGSEAIGTGYAKDGGRVNRRDGVATMASFTVSGNDNFTRISVNLLSGTLTPGSGNVLAIVEFYGRPLAELRPGSRSENNFVFYKGLSGSARVEIISVSDSTIAAVFAADVSNLGGGATPFDIPEYGRVQGGFNAVLLPAE